MKNNSFLPLYVTNFFGTLNDNFLKTLASFTVIGWIEDERIKSLAMGVTAGALVPASARRGVSRRAGRVRLQLPQGACRNGPLDILAALQSLPGGG